MAAVARWCQVDTKGKQEARKSSVCSRSDSREGIARQMNEVVAAERASRLTE